MHLHFERTINAKSDCPILSLTWMGKVPDELPEDEGWKLNRTNYYQEGWLATGNVRGIVGVTFTTSHCKKNVDFPLRTNYNLRGHRSEVILVKWNEPYQKLASCDSSGIIFVWIKYEGRWSIELINDRNTAVTHFSWSHDGRMALICYRDGFVLVGSVAGQRYWSSMLNLEATITCGIWTPDDQQVYFGTTSGQIIVMDVHGAMVSQVQLSTDVGISTMAWSCEKFKMEEGDESDGGVTNAAERKFVLAVCLQNGYIYLLKTFDDVSPIQINTHLQGGLCMEWSNSRELLAVAGSNPSGSQENITNVLKFYNEKGALIYSTVIPDTQAPVSALTWGHNDKRLFLATGPQIHIAWVSRRIASLQLLCRLRIHDSIPNETQLQLLPLPLRIRNLIGNLYAQTIRCCVPETSALREFASRPPIGSVRLHCTMIRHDDDYSLSAGTSYTLYLEYLGGLVPLLKGKRTSKIRPEFVIFDPQEDFNVQDQMTNNNHESKSSGSSSQSTSGGGVGSDTSDSDRDEGCAGSPRMQRRRKKRNKNKEPVEKPPSTTPACMGTFEFVVDELAYVDTLPEHVRLVEVTSNIWGTKFKIHGLATSVPANLGQVTYKTSLLHLQPRQMTLVITELRDDFPVGPDPNFNPNLFSEDEDEITNHEAEKSRFCRLGVDSCPPIAPMSPRCNRLQKQKNFAERNLPVVTKPDVATGEEYVELTEVMNYCDTVRPKASSSSQSTSFVGRSAAGGSSQRHAVSPLCCEGSVPALQSPKNAVAPSDIIFDRPPATQTLISYPTEYAAKPKKVDSCVEKKREVNLEQPGPSTSNSTQQPRPICLADSMVRSCSVGYLDLVDAQLVPSDVALMMLRKEAPKRLVLVNNKAKQKRQSRPTSRHKKYTLNNGQKLKNCGKSKSLDSSDIFPHSESFKSKPHEEIIPEVKKKTETPPKPNVLTLQSPAKRKKSEAIESITVVNAATEKNNAKNTNKNKKNLNGHPKSGISLPAHALATLENLLTKLKEDDKSTPPVSPRLPRSSPASPAPSKKGKRPQSASPVRKHLLSSPLLGRKNRKNKQQESSDDEYNNASGEEIFNSANYRDLETFQKAQLRQKLKRGRIEPNGSSCNNNQSSYQRREFVMHNKAPMWNENSQVYQLDFGGRVTQESAKNFQIEFRGKQVMQFGRIDGNAYTLDFQYPFSALQAFAVALANVTQRLK